MSKIASLFAMAALIAMPGGAALADAPLQGDFVGTLKSPVGPLTVAIHLRRSPSGPAATLDTVEFGARGAQLANVSETGSKLHLEDPAARAHYDASWDEAAKRWTGTWTMASGAAVPLDLSPGLPPPQPRAEGLDGDWQGSLNGGVAGVLRLVVHVRTTPDGTFATLDSPDQGGFGVPVLITRDGRNVTIAMAALGARYEGELAEDGASAQGEFTQGPQLFPLVFKRSSETPTAPGAAFSVSVAPKTWTLPSNASIRAVLARRIDQERRGVGIVVGVISPGGRRVVAYGSTDVDGKHPVDGDTLFEIGSITKTFISLILQDMALKGEVSLDDPVAKYLPGALSLPDREGRPITLRELATHTSGLPGNAFKDGAGSLQALFASATEANDYAFLAKYQSPGSSSPAWSYSNLGVGLLGLALSHRAGQDLAALVHDRVTGPLGMTATVFGIPPAGPEVAVGHDAYLSPLPPLEIGTGEAAAGAIRSSASDMLNYLSAELGYRKTRLKPAMDAMLTKDYGPALGGMDQRLGWMSFEAGGRTIYTHSGGTLGQRAFAAFDPRAGRGVIVLSNAEDVNGADDIGLWLIAGAPVRPLPPAPPAPQLLLDQAEVPLGPDQAKAYLGTYRLTRHISMTVAEKDGHLQVQTTARDRTGPWVALVFHGQDTFGVPAGPAAITFQTDGGGAARGFVLRNAAGELHAERVAGS